MTEGHSRSRRRSKDVPSLADVYDEHVWRVYGFFAYRVDSRADAEDLTQATFERALRAYGRYDPARASVGTWLLAIAHNLLIDHFRRDRSTSTHSFSDDDMGGERLAGTTEHGASLGIDPDLAEALAQLKPRDREVIALRYGGELTGQEIADLMGLSVANVQQIVSRSLRGMRAFLESRRALSG